MPICTNLCDMEPFVSQVTPQADDPSSIELFQQEIQDYLIRMRANLCTDLTCIEDRIDALDVRITVLENP